MKMGILKDIKEDIIEILLLIKSCLSTIWFWIPVLVAAYFYVQLWMIFFIHPLTLLIAPLILSIYSMLQVEKRAKARYGIDTRVVKASDPIAALPRKPFSQEREIEEIIEKYEEMLKNRKKSAKNKRAH